MLDNKKEINSVRLLQAIKYIPVNLINSSEKGILYTILSCINTDNETWHPMESIADFACVSRWSINRHMRKLEQKKFIFIKRPPHYTNYQTNHYSLNIELIMSFSVDKPRSNLQRASKTALQSATPLFETALQIAPNRVADSHTKKKEEEKKEERETSLSFFEPDEANIILCKDLSIDLQENLQSFRERHKGKKTQYEFGRWLKQNKEYKDSKKNKQYPQPIEAYSAVNRMPFSESPTKYEKIKRDLTEEPVKIQKLLPFREQLKIYQQRQGSKPNGKDHGTSTTGNKDG